MLNPEVRFFLKNHVIRPYVLDQRGSDLVFKSNEDLSEDYFDHLEFPISDFWFNYFVEKIKMSSPKSYGSALDICAGTGTVCLNIMVKNLFKECEAIDISETAISTLKKRIEKEKVNNLKASCSNIMRTDYHDEEFDCIFGNSFLHHLPDNESFLRETFRILKSGGTICFTSEPTKAGSVLENFFIGNLLKFLQFLRIKQKPSLGEVVLSDIWLYDKKTIETLLEQIGYDCIIIKGFGFLTPLFNIPFTLLFKKLSGRSMQPDWWWRLFTKLDNLLFFWLPTNAYSHFTICARKP